MCSVNHIDCICRQVILLNGHVSVKTVMYVYFRNMYDIYIENYPSTVQPMWLDELNRGVWLIHFLNKLCLGKFRNWYHSLLFSIIDEAQLRADISKLQEYRSAGIKCLAAARVYERLSNRREEEKNRRHLLTDVLNHLEVCWWCFMPL